MTIGDQAAAVEIVAMNLRGHIDNLSDLVERKKRTPEELHTFVDRLPKLEAAAVTLRWLEQNEPKIREACK